jgi:hypothetical protein
MSGARVNRAVFFALGVIGSLVLAEPVYAECAAAPDTRAVVRVAHYAGGKTGESANQLSYFLGALRGNYDMLKEELKPYTATAPFLVDFSLSLDDAEVMSGQPITIDNATDIWKRLPQTLTIFYGVINGTQGQFTVQSSIYIGDLEPPIFRMALPLQGLEYGLATDNHSMLIYYALALQAKKLGCPRDVVAHLFSRTSEIASTLLNRQLNSDERNRVVKLKQTIEPLTKPSQ